jgi:ABC-type multidrug transport system ATPase subunit
VGLRDAWATSPRTTKSQLVAEAGAERQSLEDWLGGFCPGQPIGFVKGQLAAVLFSGDEGKKKLGALSGGEAARLLFARQAVEKPNVLILDEPTNHLDIEAIEALVAAVREYDGTVVFVSHDRWFVNELATRVVEITPEGVRDYPGSYDEYLARAGEDHLDGDAVSAKAKAQADATKATEPTKEPEGGSWEEQKKRRNRLAALPARRDKVMAKIDELEEKKKAIDARYAEDGFFERTSPDEVKRLEDAKAAADGEIETLMAEWEAIEAELATG